MDLDRKAEGLVDQDRKAEGLVDQDRTAEGLVDLDRTAVGLVAVDQVYFCILAVLLAEQVACCCNHGYQGAVAKGKSGQYHYILKSN